MSNQVEIIDKIQVAFLSWPKENIYSDSCKRSQINYDLKIALALSNLEKTKCSIFFMDNKGLKRIDTTIWALCEKYILLKHGIHIPIHRIVEINY